MIEVLMGKANVTRIDDAFKTKIITTVRGVGYVIKDE